ncbi:MAG: hypothetical protein ACI9JM_000517 [Halioglobus sp.]|jgi:hypothetical protein
MKEQFSVTYFTPYVYTDIYRTSTIVAGWTASSGVDEFGAGCEGIIAQAYKTIGTAPGNVYVQSVYTKQPDRLH